MIFIRVCGSSPLFGRVKTTDYIKTICTNLCWFFFSFLLLILRTPPTRPSRSTAAKRADSTETERTHGRSAPGRATPTSTHPSRRNTAENRLSPLCAVVRTARVFSTTTTRSVVVNTIRAVRGGVPSPVKTRTPRRRPPDIIFPSPRRHRRQRRRRRRSLRPRDHVVVGGDDTACSCSGRPMRGPVPVTLRGWDSLWMENVSHWRRRHSRFDFPREPFCDAGSRSTPHFPYRSLNLSLSLSRTHFPAYPNARFSFKYNAHTPILHVH